MDIGAGKRGKSTTLTKSKGRGPKKSPRTATPAQDGWTQPKKTAVDQGTVTPTPVELQNRFHALTEDTHPPEEADNSPEVPATRKSVGVQAQTSPPSPQRPAATSPEPSEHIGATASQAWTPYNSCYFLPGRVHGLEVQFLLDTGCTTNLLARSVFNQLPATVKSTMMPHSNSYGTLADGSTMTFYGAIELPCRVRGISLTETFVVSDLGDDAILGMPFLTDRGCVMEFGRPALRIGSETLQCTDREGNQLMCRVQVDHSITIPAESEVLITGRVTHRKVAPEGLIEGTSKEVSIAASINRPDRKGRVILRCMNPRGAPLEIAAGTVVADYLAIQPEDVSVSGLEREHHQSVKPCGPGHRTLPPKTEVPSHLQELMEGAMRNGSTEAQGRQIAQLLREYHDVFSTGDGDMGRTQLVEHEIPITPGARPLRQPARRLGAEKEAEVDRQIEELLQQGLIEPAHGAWSSPVVLVKKKDGRWRFCIDYRRLNQVTVQDAYPLPRIDESLDALAGSRYFSTLDLLSGYWQVPLNPDAQEKAAFITRGGLWKWKVLPFGLTSAPATFQRLMEQVFQGLHWKTLLLYLDDVIVVAPTFEEHVHRLRQVLQRLREAGLKLKPSKCTLFQHKVKYLGHVVSEEGVSTDPEKIAAVKEWPQPSSLTELKTFLGTVGYYRQYIPDFASIAKPLTSLTAKGASWIWDEATQASFELLRERLISAPILQYPDPGETFILDTDASNDGVGAVLSQEHGGQEGVIAYFSKTLAPAERNYCVTRRELLAVIKAVKHFKPYLFGRKFRLRTDHASLIWLCKRSEPSCQVARWLEILGEFSFSIEHRPGNKHGNADGLSRRPLSTCRQCANIEKRDGGPTMAEVYSQLPPSLRLEAIQGELQQVQTESRTTPDLKIQPLQTTPPYAGSTLANAQREDSGAVGQIYTLKKEGKRLTATELQTADRELKTLHDRLDAMVIREGILKVQIARSKGMREVAICPAPMRQREIWETHRLAHAGIGKTLSRVRLTWFWPGMTRDIRKRVKTCEICQAGKNSTAPTTTGTRHMHSGRPWQLVAIDLVGPMPKSPRGNQWILVLTDHFSRWQDALAIPDATATTVATILDERVFAYLGLPEIIHTDQGTQFESELLATLCKIWGVEKTRTTAYHPEGNGVVERQNRTLGDALRTKLLGASQSDWDAVLPHIMRTLRSTPHTSTEETANLMMLGRESVCRTNSLTLCLQPRLAQHT